MITLNDRRIQLYNKYEAELASREDSPVPRTTEKGYTWLKNLLEDDDYMWRDILSYSSFVVGFIVLSRKGSKNGEWHVVDAFIDSLYRGKGFYKMTLESIPRNTNSGP